MRVRDLIRTCLAAAVCCTSAHAATKCTLGKLAELPVTMNGFEAIVRAQINGTDARFIVDSGAFYSMLSPAAAAEFKLDVYSLPFQLYVEGMGGRSQASAARVKEFRLAGVPIPKLRCAVCTVAGTVELQRNSPTVPIPLSGLVVP